MGRKRTPGLYLRNGAWHIDKLIRGRRVCESTGQRDLKKAEEHLIRRLEEARQASVFGVRPKRTFRAAATRYLRESQEKRSIADQALHLQHLDRFIGDLELGSVHMGTLQPFIEARRKDGVKAKSINLGLGVVRHILNLAASEWVDEHGLTWLSSPPKIKLLKTADSRKPYPLSLEEQERLFAELPDHLRNMALFKVNTGCRDAEVCGLRWEWEVEVPELDTSVFVIPGDRVKNGADRLVVLNSVARAIVEAQRGMHAEFVFVYSQVRKAGKEPIYRPIETMNNTSWQKARRRAGLPQVRVHDLKHTFGRRLRAAGVSFEDRQDLLGPKSGRITTHYSGAELSVLIEAAEKACQAGSRKSPAMEALKQKAAGAVSPNRLMSSEESGAPGRI
ncbi:MAG: tyrosine-type recombinase/integrase [Sphingomonadaceae bacterium]